MNEWKYRTFGFVYWFGIYIEKHNRSMSIVAIIMVHMFHLSLGKFAYLCKSRKKTIETINVDVFCEQNDQEENNTKNALKAFYKRCYFFHESLSNKLNGSNIIRMCFFLLVVIITGLLEHNSFLTLFLLRCDKKSRGRRRRLLCCQCTEEWWYICFYSQNATTNTGLFVPFGKEKWTNGHNDSNIVFFSHFVLYALSSYRSYSPHRWNMR